MSIKKAWINLTDCCNNRCLWCYAQNSMFYKIMPYMVATNILDSLADAGCPKCVFIGGEPTLHPQFEDILAYGLSRKIRIGLVTNGRKFSNMEFCRKMLDIGVSRCDITFSMHSSSRQNSKALTGVSAYFDEFEHGFDNLISNGVNPAVDMVISKYSIDLLDDMFSWAVEHKATQLLLNLGSPAVSQKGIKADFALTPQELGQEVVDIYRRTKYMPFKIKTLFIIPFCVLPREDVRWLLSTKKLNFGCQVRTGSCVAYNVFGDLITCNHLLDFPVYKYDEIMKISKNGRLENVWKWGKGQQISEAACTYRSEMCKGCDYWDICGGGCPMFWSHFNPLETIKGFRESQKENSYYV